MHKLAMTAIAATLAFAAPAFADHDHHAQKGEEAKAGSAKPAAMSAATVQKIQDHVKKMQAQLDRIAKASTDEERQKATAELSQMMRGGMKMARGMKAGKMDCPMMEGGMMHKGGMGMMGGGMMGGGMGAKGDGAHAGGSHTGGSHTGDSAERMQQMEKRMDMMQMMMEQMMRRPEGQQSVPVK